MYADAEASGVTAQLVALAAAEASERVLAGPRADVSAVVREAAGLPAVLLGIAGALEWYTGGRGGGGGW